MLLHTVRKICTPRALNVAGLTRTVDVVADRRGIKLVLGWLVHLAMSNGTTKLRMGINRDTGEPWLKFFGPRWYRSPTWWEIVPPEAYCYPVMLQVCLSLAKLEEGFPLRGIIPGIKQGRRLSLEFELDELESFQIAWDPQYACDREQAGTTYREEEQSRDGRGDSHATRLG